MFFSCNWFAKGVTVELNNLDSAAITNIVVSYSGGSQNLPLLTARNAHKFIVNPDSESSLKLKYLDGAGNPIEKEIDVYIEKNYTGKVIITINEGNKIEVVNNIRL